MYNNEKGFCHRPPGHSARSTVHNKSLCDVSPSTLLEEDLSLSSDEEVNEPVPQVRYRTTVLESLVYNCEAAFVGKSFIINTNSLNSFPL